MDDESSGSEQASKKIEWQPITPVPDDAPQKIPSHQLGAPSQTWNYKNANGKLLWINCRFELPDGKKELRPLTYCKGSNGKEAWRWKGLQAPRPLYGLDILSARPDDPVLICEGEKTADAAAILFPEYVVITSSNGAGGAAKSDWLPTKNRDLIIWPDNDAEGLSYANTVTGLVRNAGAASVATITIPAAFPAKWDLADILPEGLSVTDLRVLLENPSYETEPPPQNSTTSGKLPPGFFMGTKGLYWQDENDTEKPPVHVSGPFEIVAETRDVHGDSWGTLIRWLDNDGRQHEWALPRGLLAGDASEVRARLLDGGLYVSPSRAGRDLLTTFLIGVKTDARARCVDKVGWHGLSYVTSSKTFGDTNGEHLILQTATSATEFAQLGFLQAWQEQVAALAVGNSRVVLALSAAFVGPLLYLANEESFGFHFAGGSSGGKTTTLRVATSVWGNALNSWRTTDNAAESLARGANDGLLVLDELSQADGRAADAMAYMLGNGQGKGRMRKDLSSRPASTWRLLFLSTGEIGLAEKLGEAGRKSKAGQSVRMIEIPADAGAGHKLFETLHGFADGAALANHLRLAVEQHKGHAAEEFLNCIVGNVPLLQAKIGEGRKKWLDENCPTDADGQVSRVAARFALTAMAGELASSIGLLPWPDGEASRAAAICFQAWIDNRGGSHAAETMAGVDQVRAFIEQHGASRFAVIGESQVSEPDSKTINRAGFRRRNTSGQWEYLVLPTVWTDEICKGIDAKATAKNLIAAGHLCPGKTRSAKQVKIPGYGNMRVYLLLADFLTEEADDA